MNDNLKSLAKRIHPLFYCIIILLLLWLLFFWRFLTTNPADQLRFAQGDFTLHYYAFASYQVEQIQAGNLTPLWNPYNYGGDPFMGNIQWATWYPLRFLTAFIAGSDGLSIEEYQFEIVLHYLLVSIMMLAFLKQITKRWEAALFGSLIYTYGSYLTGYPMLQPSVLAAVAWTPLIMLGVHLSVTREKWHLAGILLGSVGIAISFFGGHPQTTMQMIYFAGAYLLFLGWLQKLSLWEIIWRGILLIGLGIGLAMVQLLPAAEFTSLSARVQQLFFDAKSNGLGAYEFFQTLYPFIISGWSPLYLGVVGLLMATGSILSYRREYLFWLIVIILGSMLSMGGTNIVYDLFYLMIPGFDTFRQQERIASLVVFALVVLATYRFDLLLIQSAENENRQRITLIIHAIGTILIAFILTLASPFITMDKFFFPLRGEITFLTIAREVTTFVAILSILFLAWYFWQRRFQGARWFVAAPIIALVVLDLFTFNTRYTINFVPNEAQYITQPPEYIEILQTDIQNMQWRVDGGASLQGYGTYWRIPDMYGTGPFELNSTETLLHIGVDKRWELFSVRYASQPEGANPPENVALEVIGDGINYFGGVYTLYELQNPRPMAQLIYDVQIIDDPSLSDEERNQQIRERVNDAINLRETAVIGQALAFELSGTRPSEASVSYFQMLQAEYVEMTVSTSENALLSLSIPNYPAWTATVNGESVEIIEVYAEFIGIPLAAGENQQIVLRMQSETFQFGGLISLASIATGTILLFWSFRPRNIRQVSQEQ
jgi:membrane protein YfhO